MEAEFRGCESSQSDITAGERGQERLGASGSRRQERLRIGDAARACCGPAVVIQFCARLRQNWFDAPMFRLDVAPDDSNGLAVPLQIMIGKVWPFGTRELAGLMPVTSSGLVSRCAFGWTWSSEFLCREVCEFRGQTGDLLSQCGGSALPEGLP
jgi:hypothetical protein